MADERNGCIIYAIYSPDGNHSIWRYYVKDEFHAKLCYGDFLNFQPNWHVQFVIVDGRLLYWTDGTSNKGSIEGNVPRMLNLDKADNTGKNFSYEVLVEGGFADDTVYRIDFYDQNFTPTGESDEYTITGVAGDKAAGLQLLTDWLNSLNHNAGDCHH